MMCKYFASHKGRRGACLAGCLAVALLLSALTGLFALPVQAATKTVGTFTLADTSKAVIEVGSSMGLRLGMAAPFTAIAISTPTWSTTDSSATLSLYRWDTNRQTTEAGEALLSQNFDPLKDNGMTKLQSDTPLEAGEYYLLISDVKGRVGVWVKEGNSAAKGLLYRGNTEEPYDLLMEVDFVDPPADPFTALAPQVVEEKKTERVDVPEDSLYHKNTVQPDTWVFTDGLGRVSLTNADVGDVREDRTLALFFWTWHEELGSGNGAVNTTEFLKLYPDAKNDYNHPAWKGTGHYCFWNEPIYGFYRTGDTWVLRRQAELLANAGVDVIFNDNTNGSMTWKRGYTPLYETWVQALDDGVASPKVSFLLPFGPNDASRSQANSIYNDIYAQGKYSELWYYLDDKPMLMAHSSNLSSELTDFFTFRAGQPVYKPGTTALGSWGWLSTYPQARYYGTRDNRVNKIIEQMTVGVAVNHNYVTDEITAMNGVNVMGRSYTSTYKDRYDQEGPEASLWGYNFSEQLAYALEKDPKVLFITGWNEWHAWRQPTPWGGAHSQVNNALVDQFDNEFSRDLEPTKGELKDHYYYLFVNAVRQYKGCTPIPVPTVAKTVDINAGEEQWQDVGPYFRSYANNIGDRDYDGYGGYHYTENSGRNDIIGAQVARDDDNLYFHVECASDITKMEDTRWMNLYIDCNQESSGWESFDYVVRPMSGTNRLVLDKFTGEGYETKTQGQCKYSVNGRYLTIQVPKKVLGISGDDYTVNFAVTDNVHDEDNINTFSGDILDFYISGDVAPGGRFKYSFISTAENSGKQEPETSVETETDIETETETETAVETETAIETESETVAETETEAVTVVETDTAGTPAATVTAAVTAEDKTEPAPASTGTDAGATSPSTASAGTEGCSSSLIGAGMICLLPMAAALLYKRKKRK